MTIRNKALGLVAAAALSFSMIAGVSADTSNLGAQENPNGVCSVSAGDGTIDYGTYVYDGTAFQRTTPQPVLTLDVSQNIAPENTTVGCNVTINASDLTNTSDSQYVVSRDHLRVAQGQGDGAVSQAFIGYPNLVVENGEGDMTYNLIINLASEPASVNGSIPAVGTYEGTVTLTTSRYVAP